MTKTRRAKRGELRLTEVHIAKAELDAVPEAERIHFLMLAQTANELAMLRILTIQALNGAKGKRAVVETGLGIAFMLSRILAGRVHEAWDLLRKPSLIEVLEANMRAIPPADATEFLEEVGQAREAVIAYFADPTNLLKKVRNKVAFHHDRATVVGAYALVPDDLELVDFHTGTRGSTFYGAADTIAALSISHLIGSDDPAEGQKRLSHEATRMSGLLENIIDGYLVGFAARHLGIERFRVEPNVILRGLTSGAQAKLTFYVDDRPLRRLADGA